MRSFPQSLRGDGDFCVFCGLAAFLRHHNFGAWLSTFATSQKPGKCLFVIKFEEKQVFAKTLLFWGQSRSIFSWPPRCNECAKDITTTTIMKSVFLQHSIWLGCSWGKIIIIVAPLADRLLVTWPLTAKQYRRYLCACIPPLHGPHRGKAHLLPETTDFWVTVCTVCIITVHVRQGP